MVCDFCYKSAKVGVGPVFAPLDIPIMFYLDEFEPCNCNPIGSRQKVHKLTGMYFTIASLPAHLRAKLKSIFLYGLVYYKYVKIYVYRKVLGNLVNELNDFNQNPLQITGSSGEKLSFVVRLLLLCADILSAHHILGLQTHFNHGKVSRYCLTDHSEMRSKFDLISGPTRSQERYKQQVAQLETFPQRVKLDYGIVGKCVFDEIPCINVTRLAPPDVMHDFMEGVIPAVICVAVLNIWQHTDLTLDRLNEKLSAFNFMDQQMLKTDFDLH